MILFFDINIFTKTLYTVCISHVSVSLSTYFHFHKSPKGQNNVSFTSQLHPSLFSICSITQIYIHSNSLASLFPEIISAIFLNFFFSFLTKSTSFFFSLTLSSIIKQKQTLIIQYSTSINMSNQGILTVNKKSYFFLLIFRFFIL